MLIVGCRSIRNARRAVLSVFDCQRYIVLTSFIGLTFQQNIGKCLLSPRQLEFFLYVYVCIVLVGTTN